MRLTYFIIGKYNPVIICQKFQKILINLIASAQFLLDIKGKTIIYYTAKGRGSFFSKLVFLLTPPTPSPQSLMFPTSSQKYNYFQTI